VFFLPFSFRLEIFAIPKNDHSPPLVSSVLPCNRRSHCQEFPRTGRDTRLSFKEAFLVYLVDVHID
jgi:hypothetical protein